LRSQRIREPESIFVDTAQRPESDAQPSVQRGGAVTRVPRVRSRASNRLRKHPGFHGSSAQGRRFADIVLSLAAQFGGEDKVDPDTASLIREIGSLTIAIEGLQGRLMRQEPIDDEKFIRYSNTLDRKREKLRVIAERKAQAKLLTSRARVMTI
jgi:hypothetical protein